MIIAILILILVLMLFVIYQYLKQQRLNRLLLYLFHSQEHDHKKDILDHMYFEDVLKLKKDMNQMISCDIDTSDLEKLLKK